MAILTAEDHANFIFDGILVLRGLVPRDICDAAAAKLDEVAPKGTKPGDGVGVHAEVQACITDKVKQVMDELLGDEHKRDDYGDPASIMTAPQETLKKDLLAPDVLGMHLDDDYPTIISSGWCLRIIVFPRKVISGGGAFIYSPGSHIRHIAQMMQSPEDVKKSTLTPALASPIREFTCEAGDTVVMSSLLAHSGSHNWTSPLSRHLIALSAGIKRPLSIEDRPLDDLATVEKAFTPRYFTERLGIKLRHPEIGEPNVVDRILAEGWRPEEGIGGYDILRWGGATHLYVASPDGRKQVRRFVARDWSGFAEKNPIQVKNRAARVHLNQCYAGTRLSVGTGAAEEPELHLYHTDMALMDWEHLGHVRAGAGATFRWSIWGSRSTDGYALLYVDGTTVRRRLAAAKEKVPLNWSDVPASDDDEQVWGGDGRQVADVFVHSVLGESRFALMMDIDDGDGPVAHYIVSNGDGCQYGDAAANPLLLHDDLPVHGVRVYMRARSFWLVTYLKDTADGARLFWGTVEWGHPAINPIRNSQELEGALRAVGLR